MTQTFWTYSALTFLTALGGGLLPLWSSVKDSYLKLFVSLGAGLLLGMSLVHLLPEAAELVPDGFGIWFLAGFVLLLILERFVMVHSCEEHGCNYHTVGIAAFVGLAVHGVIEGIALASTVIAMEVAPLLLVAILVHKAPAALTLTSLLRLGGKSRPEIVRFIIGIALTTPVGILLAAYAFRLEAFPSAAGTLLAISGGTFLYIAACDLLPELHRTSGEKFRRLAAFLVGVGLSFFAD